VEDGDVNGDRQGQGQVRARKQRYETRQGDWRSQSWHSGLTSRHMVGNHTE